MTNRILNMLRNHKEWLELHRVPLLGRRSDDRLFARYAMSRAAAADLWEADPDALYVGPLVEANAVVLDVGANLGTFCYTVRHTGRPVHLLAFEPIPSLAKRLRRVFKDITVMEVALSNTTAVRTFRIPFIDGRRCNSRGSLAPIVDSSTYRELTVHTDLLDNVFPATGHRSLDLVKIDVEGHELEVIKGGERTLRTHHPVLLVEIEQRHHGADPISSIWRFIEGLGYGGYYLNRQTLVFDPLDTFRLEVHQRSEDMGTHRYVNNFLFLSHAAAAAGWPARLTSHLRDVLGRRGMDPSP